ncbi:hypothetical protein FQN60_002874 [Etheostoma spectabile]|uniref:Uncharacterized protein n=1 Tax=Etheostoma spectabile TaxID=54343 RepID=A0A5J5CKQ4_9PERO|nr:hypothetical protein FQN60_002874 [Etheostoma spectabile]
MSEEVKEKATGKSAHRKKKGKKNENGRYREDKTGRELERKDQKGGVYEGWGGRDRENVKVKRVGMKGRREVMWEEIE